MTTTGNGAGPSFYCPGDGVHSIIRVRNASGRIAYYTDSATFYFVDACAGEPTGLVYVTTGSGETQESIVRVNEFGRTFAGEDLYIVRCQEPNSTHLIELWPSTPE